MFSRIFVDRHFPFLIQIKNSFKNNYENALKEYNATRDYRSEAVDKIQSTVSA